jgi:hypothetical protein
MLDDLTQFVTTESFKDLFVKSIMEAKRNALKAMVNNPTPDFSKTQYNEIDMMLKCQSHIEKFVVSLLNKSIMEIVSNKELEKKDQDKLQKDIAELKKMIIDFI